MNDEEVAESKSKFGVGYDPYYDEHYDEIADDPSESTKKTNPMEIGIMQ